MALLVLSMMPAAVQSSYLSPVGLDIEPPTQEILFGEIRTYTVNVTVQPHHVGRKLRVGFNTRNNSILANLIGPDGFDTGVMRRSRTRTWTPIASGIHTFTFSVSPQSGLMVGTNHRMTIRVNDVERSTAMSHPAVVPIPELATMILVGLGLSGLGLVKKGKKD